MSHSHGGFLKGSLSLETSRSCTPATPYVLAYRAIAQLRPISDYRTAPTKVHTKSPVSSIHLDEHPQWIVTELAWAAVLFERAAVDLDPEAHLQLHRGEALGEVPLGLLHACLYEFLALAAVEFTLLGHDQLDRRIRALKPDMRELEEGLATRVPEGGRDRRDPVLENGPRLR